MFQDHRIAYLRRHVKIREVQPLSFIRQSVSYLLSISARKIPHAAMINEFDVTALVEYGKSSKSNTSQAETDYSEKSLFRKALHRNFSAFFLKAIAHGLYHVPCMNGFLDYTPYRNGGTLYCAEDINLSFTVHTKYGIIKPIVRNAHLKDIETVAREMRELARRARRTDIDRLYRRAGIAYLKEGIRQLDYRGLSALWILVRDWVWRRYKADPELANVPLEEQLGVEDILGSTCTLANIGMMVPGCQTVTVIIPPETTMFGIGDLHVAPRVVNGQIVPRYVISMMATMDHRAYDAGEAFPFARYIQKYFDSPALIYEYKPGDEI